MKWLLPLLLYGPAYGGEADTIRAAVEREAILSGYCDCVSCCGSFPGKIRGQTASGKMATAGRTLAMPRCFPFGAKVFCDGKLLGVCEDRGGAIKMRGKVIRIDVYFASHKEALKFGKKKVKITIFLEGKL